MESERGGPSTQPLTPEQEAALLAWARRKLTDPDPYQQFRARVVLTFYFLGLHPIILADPERYHLRSDGVYAMWDRTKTRQPIRFPLVPDLRAWFKPWIESGFRRTRQTYWKILHNAGAELGFPLCPRTARHDLSARLMESANFNTAKALTGTTDKTLIGYGHRAAARADLEKIARDGI